MAKPPHDLPTRPGQDTHSEDDPPDIPMIHLCMISALL